MIRHQPRLRTLLMACVAVSCHALAALPDDAQVKALLDERLAQKRGVGFAVALFDADGIRIVTAGAVREGGPPIAADTEFEIGSITKTMTALLLSDAIVRGDLHADDPVQKLIPGATGLTRGGKVVTLGQLASHRSGLPPLPGNWKPGNRADPYADYTSAMLLELLAGAPLIREPGSQYEYSNLAGGTLGFALSYRDGGYAAVLKQRVLDPLRMTDTGIVLTPAQQTRLAPGHDGELRPVPPWTFDALAGAGGVRSTASDMAKYLQAAVDPASSPLGAAFTLAETPFADGPVPTVRVGLGWHATTRGNLVHVWHNGRTGGYASMMAMNLSRREGVVVLSNASVAVEDLALHILEPSIALIPPIRQRTAMTVLPAQYDEIAGRYELAPGFVLTIRRDGAQLFAQASGQGSAEIFPEADYEYFYKAADIQISFVRDDARRVTGLVLHQNGRDTPGRRLD